MSHFHRTINACIRTTRRKIYEIINLSSKLDNSNIPFLTDFKVLLQFASLIPTSNFKAEKKLFYDPPFNLPRLNPPKYTGARIHNFSYF